MDQTVLRRGLAGLLLAAALVGPVAVAAPAQAAPGRPAMCRASALRGALVDDGGGALGSLYVAIRLTNTGGRTCTLQGWPGVSLVGHHDGTQLGAAAQQDRTGRHPVVTLRPGRSLRAPLRVVEALNYPRRTCRPVRADGFRVYPPGSYRALFVPATGLTGCANPKVHLLTISAVRPAH